MNPLELFNLSWSEVHWGGGFKQLFLFLLKVQQSVGPDIAVVPLAGLRAAMVEQRVGQLVVIFDI